MDAPKPADPAQTQTHRHWYSGISKYQWTVLLIASLGWVFDVFEGQIFVASMREAMPSLLPKDTAPETIQYYNNIALGAFLLGGALGGVLFGMLSDKIGRTRTMIITILMYSLFTSVTAFAQTWWQMAALRFLVAMGVGGEWAVASALIAEVFPKRARAWSLGIFHASSVFGTFLAVAAGAFIVANPKFGWRWGFLIGALPALLTLWIRWRLREPEKWIEAKQQARTDVTQRTGHVLDLLKGSLASKTVIGVLLAAVGLATFWGVHIYGKDLMRGAAITQLFQEANLSPTASSADKNAIINAHLPIIKKMEMLGMLLVTAGGGLGLLAFGPVSEWIGRRGAFLLFHLGGFAMTQIAFRLPVDVGQSALWIILPIFGFLTLGMHAGYAIYFPELFPTRLRGTGAGFCFNLGRVLAAPILFASGWMQKEWGYNLSESVLLLNYLFLVGVVLLIFAPETRGTELPR